MDKKFGKGGCIISKKRHVHIGFRKSISDYDCLDKILELISEEWEKSNFFFEVYKRIYPRLITSLKWRFDYLIYKKEKLKN